MKSKEARQARGYIATFGARLRGPGGRPFYECRLDKDGVDSLLKKLDDCASEGREWFTMAALEPNLDRLTLTMSTTPQFERSAAGHYARGDVFRVSGRLQSCNVDFSTTGAAILARELRAARKRMREFLVMRVPNRKRAIVEFLPDVDVEAAESTEHATLAIAGEHLASQVWPRDDFSDWES